MRNPAAFWGSTDYLGGSKPIHFEALCDPVRTPPSLFNNTLDRGASATGLGVSPDVGDPMPAACFGRSCGRPLEAGACHGKSAKGDYIDTRVGAFRQPGLAHGYCASRGICAGRATASRAPFQRCHWSDL